MLRILMEGRNFDIYALTQRRDNQDYCPVLEFIDQIPEASRKSILNVIRSHALSGPLLNEQKSRLLEDGIYEFKSRQGDRLLYFYSRVQRRLTIVTHGFHKGVRVRTEIDRAKDMRLDYLRTTC